VAEQLLIGDVTALTGIAAGRIRHYQKIGLLQGEHLSNGYRVFDVEQVLELLRIDLLRSLGIGIKDIGRVLDGDHTTVADLLSEHRNLLLEQRARLDELIAAIDAAAESGLLVPHPVGDTDEHILQRLATSHRNSIGVIGRLRSPLSPEAAALFAELLGDWNLPVAPLFGQMLLPAASTSLLEKLAHTAGCAELFGRLRYLAGRVLALGDDDGEAAERLALEWVASQLDDPLPTDVLDVVRSEFPALASEPVIVQGFPAWATSINPAAAQFLGEVARLSAQHGVDVLSVIVLPAPAAQS
jgi:DNA-binding transcriptional MerR regulator